MRNLALASAGLLLLAGSLLLADEAVQVSPRAEKLHRRSIVLDTHMDTTLRLSSPNYDFGKRNATGHVDLPRMREGGLNAAFWSIYISGTITGPEAVKRALRLIDTVRELVRRYPNDLMLATTAAEVRRAHKQGKIAVLMGLEGGHMIDDDLGVLRAYAALGIRYLTLTHGRNTNWADSSSDTPRNNGLTDFGKQAIRELNRLGVMVDVSHASDKTFYDALEASRAPIIASHSSLRSICNVPRNMTDDMVRALAKNGGVIQINYATGFLSQEYADAETPLREERRARLAEVDQLYANDPARRTPERERINREFAARVPKVTWEKIVEHIDRAVKLVGVDHVGLGSDFDGATMPAGMDDCSMLPRITDALLKKGYSEKDVQKILGGNLLRVMEEVERVSRQLQSQSTK
jgi:membrane dipeptidase